MANPTGAGAAATDQRPRPALWLRVSIPVGTGVQLGGMALGALLLYLAASWHTLAAVRVLLMLVGFFAIYDCCHALAHWAIGRLVGIRFRGYGLRSTDHPEDYPPGLRQLMSVLPFFTAMTVKESMQRASPGAKAAMFAAGETSSTVCSLTASFYAWRSGIPGGQLLFVVMVVFTIFSTNIPEEETRDVRGLPSTPQRVRQTLSRRPPWCQVATDSRCRRQELLGAFCAAVPPGLSNTAPLRACSVPSRRG